MSAAAESLSSLLRAARITPLARIGPDPAIRAVQLDSRRVESGDLFCALAGARTSGERFVPEAIERGALAILAGSPPPPSLARGVAWVQVAEPRLATGLLARERSGRPDEALTLAGVTGTNGKTTVALMIAAIAEAAGRRAGVLGTLGFRFEDTAGPLPHTTPEAPELYRLLDEMRRQGVAIVAMEVSSHALVEHRVAGARFAVGAFLNLGRDHLDFHGDERSYFEAKARLIETLDANAVAVLPAEAPWTAELRGRTAARVLTFGSHEAADVRLLEAHSGLGGSSAVLETPGGRLPLRTFLLGSFNLTNAAAAAAAAIGIGLPLQAVASGILALESVPGRMERVDCGQPFTVLVDFAHTPHALESILGWLRPLTPGRLHVVFGCGGERDRGKRPVMGRVAARSADVVLVTSDNPRREEPRAIIDEILAGIDEPERAGRLAVEPDRGAAIARALAAAGAGDVVVLAGTGAETTQTIGERRAPFDDRLSARAALARLGFEGGRRGHV
jgi:UDP-N-acetylmuramoyl-L-alanyl-D-glutamate--2,6-diaminopimelate ligase